MRDCCSRLGKAVGIDIVNDPDNIWIALIGVDVQPLDLFLNNLRRNYDEVNEDFRQEYGFDLPLEPPGNPQEVSRRIRFWEYVRRRFSELALLQNTVLRRHVRGHVVGNIEFDTEVDYSLWMKAYDVPGFNMRTALFEDEIGYRYWVGYGTKLTADLTHKAPMISVRTNQVAAGQELFRLLLQRGIGTTRRSRPVPGDSISGSKISTATSAIRRGTQDLVWLIPTPARTPWNVGKLI